MKRAAFVPPPLPGLGELEGRWLVVLIVIFFLVTQLMGELGRPLVNASNPRGILGLELAGTAAETAAVLASWDRSARDAAWLQTVVDFLLYIPVYVVSLGAWAAWVSRRVTIIWLSIVSAICGWAMWIAGAADMIENTAMLIQLAGGADGALSALTRAAAIIKFSIAYATSTAVVIGTVCVVWNRRAR